MVQRNEKKKFSYQAPSFGENNDIDLKLMSLIYFKSVHVLTSMQTFVDFFPKLDFIYLCFTDTYYLYILHIYVLFVEYLFCPILPILL